MSQNENKLRIPETLRKVKNIIGVFSAKGGVGKSAISLQIALALKEKGLRVGLVDADIYGPSQPILLNSKPGELKLTQSKRDVYKFTAICKVEDAIVCTAELLGAVREK